MHGSLQMAARNAQAVEFCLRVCVANPFARIAFFSQPRKDYHHGGLAFCLAWTTTPPHPRSVHMTVRVFRRTEAADDLDVVEPTLSAKLEAYG